MYPVVEQIFKKEANDVDCNHISYKLREMSELKESTHNA